ncbi:MAG: type IV pilin N-terminal domain-containing protein [Halapricum sp.]
MHTLRTDERAVPPVVGVVLMVAITILLASTAAVFFFQFGSDTNANAVQQVSIDADYEQGTSDVLKFTHATGESLRVGDLSVVISDAKVSNGSADLVNTRHEVEDLDNPYGSESQLTAGNSIEISSSSLPDGISGLDLSEATVKLVWDSDSSPQSTEIRTWTGPDA